MHFCTNFWRIYKLTIRKWLRNLFSAKLQDPKWPHIYSQSPVFGLTVLCPTGSEIWRFWFIKTPGRKIDIKIFVLLFLSVYCGDFIDQTKKKSVIYALIFQWIITLQKILHVYSTIKKTVYWGRNVYLFCFDLPHKQKQN